MTAISVSTTITSGRRRLVNARQRSLVIAKRRVLLVLLLFAVFACCALMRIALLGILEPAAARGGSAAEALLPERGDIVDRNGTVLARSFQAYSLRFNPDALGGGSPLVKTPEEVAAALVRMFPDMDKKKLIAKLSGTSARSLRRRILPEDANRIHALGEPALEFPRENERYYPQGSMAAHVLGYVSSDETGRVGMEEVFDKQLTDPLTRGTPSVISIDSRVQGALEDELGRGMYESRAAGAAGIVLDVDTGEVLALASLPAFNPNRIEKSDTPNMLNRVTSRVYELGSTFKPFTVASALDAGTVTDLGRRYQASRPLVVGGFPIRDSHPLGDSLNVPEALIHSSNIVTAQIADELGEKHLKATMRSLGFNERPYIELPARGFPIWKKGKWGRLKTMTVSYGHGIAVTPLHLATGYAALVNGGVWRPATLRKLDRDHVPAGRRVFKASTSARMRQLLRMIVVHGTGKKADAPGFRVGGKTGSAEKSKKDGRGYQRKVLVSTFAAAFPMDRPRYVVVAMLDEPKGTTATSYQRTAAWNAAPVVGRVVPRIGPLLGVMPDETRDVDITDLKPLIPDEVTE